MRIPILVFLLSIFVTSAQCFFFGHFFGAPEINKAHEVAGVGDRFKDYPGATWCEADSRLYRYDGRPLPGKHNRTLDKAFQSFCRKHHFYGENHVQEDCYPFVLPPDNVGDKLTLRVEYNNADYLAPDKCLKELRKIHHTCFFGGKGLGLDQVSYHIIPRRGDCDTKKFHGWAEDVPVPDDPAFGGIYEHPRVKPREFHA